RFPQGTPVLRGADFFARWNNRSVGDLYRAISQGMPEDAPGSLSAADVADLVSFLLKKNRIPAGDTELPLDASRLNQTLITEKPSGNCTDNPTAARTAQ